MTVEGWVPASEVHICSQVCVWVFCNDVCTDRDEAKHRTLASRNVVEGYLSSTWWLPLLRSFSHLSRRWTHRTHALLLPIQDVFVATPRLILGIFFRYCPFSFVSVGGGRDGEDNKSVSLPHGVTWTVQGGRGKPHAKAASKGQSLLLRDNFQRH